MHKPIATALLSYGMSGKIFHAPLLHAHPGFVMTKVWQRNSQDARSRYPDVTVVSSLHDILEDNSIELVIVNTPNHTHFDFAAKALEAGKHVVLEKPFTTDVKEGEKLITLAQQKRKILTVFQNRRWDGDFMAVKKIIKKKSLGHLVEFEAHYDRYRNYVEANTWKEEPGKGVGILYNLGSHMIDQVLSLFGKPAAVDARLGIQRPGGKVDDYYDIRMEYPGLLVILKSSYLVREPGPRYILHGVDGSFVKYGIDPQEQSLKDGVIPGTAGWGTEEKKYWGKLNTQVDGDHYEGLVETEPGNYLLFYDNVYEAVRDNKPLIVKPEESLQGICVIEAALESNRLKKSISL
ncbi:MAG: Gfo/Idh/MocA family oxidoreductase [Bacteroidota bacterium]